MDRVVLVNPATSYPVSMWPYGGQILQLLDDGLYQNVIPYLLMPVLSDPIGIAAGYVKSNTPSLEAAQQFANVRNCARVMIDWWFSSNTNLYG